MRLPIAPRALLALGVVVPVALVGFGVGLTVFSHVAACPLCIVQRMLYLAIATLSFVGLFFATHATWRVISGLLIAIVAATGASIAGYQIYLQRHPFAATCGDGSAWWERAVDAAGQALPMLFKADGLCSDSTWSLWGLSIVEWSLLAFSALFVLGLITLFARSRR